MGFRNFFDFQKVRFVNEFWFIQSNDTFQNWHLLNLNQSEPAIS